MKVCCCSMAGTAACDVCSNRPSKSSNMHLIPYFPPDPKQNDFIEYLLGTGRITKEDIDKFFKNNKKTKEDYRSSFSWTL